MAENSGIEWTRHTWSPWRGCTKVSAGCTNCYADSTAKRNPGTLGIWGPNGSRVVNADWDAPRRWNRQAEKAGERWRIFPSMCDPFEDWGGKHVLDPQGNVMWERQGKVVRSGQTTVGKVYRERPATIDDVRRQFFRLIDATPHLDWILLTKRPENIGRMLPEYKGWLDEARPNVWLGTSVENADYYWRIEELQTVPAAVRFLSVEPLLGPVDDLPLVGIDWVIVGGESGPKARPCQLRWIRSIRDQCESAGVACFVKQLGAQPFETGDAAEPFDWQQNFDSYTGRTYLRLKDKKGGDWSEWPADLRVREFPTLDRKGGE